jgi:3-oxoacyl-[acyl-carrier protein] reductase
MDLQLKNKTALIFGSSAGLGRAIAEVLISEGVRVVLAARHIDNLLTTKNEIKAFDAISCDLSLSGVARLTTQKALDKLGHIDILVTNTGGPTKNSFVQVDEKQWSHDFQSLWMSFVEATQVVLPVMKKNHFGRILLVTSIAAKEPLSGLTTSNGLRAGLAGLAKSLANEVASDGITINTLLPGYTATDRLKELNLSQEQVQKMVPAGRLGDPKELASLAAFLASPLAGYITGQSIAVDGGVLRGH